jgi:hypothetical protein
VVLALVIGLSCGGAVAWLLGTDHEGFVAAALFAAVHLGPMLLLLTVGSLIALGIRREGWRPMVRRGIVAALLLGVPVAVVATVFLAGFLEAMAFHRQLARLPALAAVEIGCQTARDPVELAELQQALRQSQWFMPVSHGWTGAFPLEIRTEAGEQRTYWLTEIAYKGKLVLNPTRTSASLATSQALATALTRHGAIRITRRVSTTGRSYWEASADRTCAPRATQ